MSDLDNMDLLDMDLDDLADLPETKPFATGAHRVYIKVQMGKKDDKPNPNTYIAQLTYIAEEELADPNTPEEARSKEGDQCSVFFHIKKKDGSRNEFGEGQLKAVVRPLARALNVSKLSEVIEATQDGVEVIVQTKYKPAKGEYDASMEIKAIEVV